MIFQEGDIVWYETSGEEALLACITEVDFELYILVDVRTDEEFCSFPDNLKPFDFKPPAEPSGKHETQEDPQVKFSASTQDWDLGGGLHFKEELNVSLDGLIGKEAKTVLKVLAARIATKAGNTYSSVMGYMRAHSVRSTHVCLRGSRVLMSRMSNRRPEWDDTAGVVLLKY
jgi:hypothetical protein